MLRKLFLVAAIASTSVGANAASSMPNVLSGLTGGTAMSDASLSKVKGTGNLPSDFAFRDYYYNWNNYGDQADFRSYIYDMGATYTGGIDSGNGAWTGEEWIVSINGNQSVIEQRALFIEPDGSGGYQISNGISGSDWNRSWDGSYHPYYDYSHSI